MRTVDKNNIVADLTQLGLKQGDVVIVHTSLKSIGYVCGGAQTVIEALIEVVTSEGTIVMPTQSWKNLDPETGVHWNADESDWDKIRENWPAYDKQITPTNTMGAVAEMFRQWPGASEQIIQQDQFVHGENKLNILQRNTPFQIYLGRDHLSQNSMNLTQKYCY